MPTFIPLFESRMLTWKKKGERFTRCCEVAIKHTSHPLYVAILTADVGTPPHPRQDTETIYMFLMTSVYVAFSKQVTLHHIPLQKGLITSFTQQLDHCGID